MSFYRFLVIFQWIILPGLSVYFLVLPGHIPTQTFGKLPPPLLAASHLLGGNIVFSLVSSLMQMFCRVNINSTLHQISHAASCPYQKRHGTSCDVITGYENGLNGEMSYSSAITAQNQLNFRKQIVLIDIRLTMLEF